jgi:hypothetical protein
MAHCTSTGARRGLLAGAGAAAALAGVLVLAPPPAQAAEGFDLTVPPASVPAPALTADSAQVDTDGISSFFTAWGQWVARARATQPHWSSPLVTTTGLLEQRLRFDVEQQHSGNGTDTTVLDGGRGLDLIVSDTNEVQFAAAPYDIRSGVPGTGPKKKGAIPAVQGFADWAFLRVEQRLAASPESDGNYVLTAWLQIQAPAGIEPLTNRAWTYLPTLAFGKGFGDFDIQTTVGGSLPSSHTATLGDQIVTNIALQYHVMDVFWPELEANWTYYADGQRGGLNQLYLTPGLVVGRFALNDNVQLTFGAGYQSAVTPSYRAKPLTPAYNHAWLFTSRLNF